MRLYVVVAAFAIGVLTPAAFAGDGVLKRFETLSPGPAPVAASAASNTWFVELGSPPTADGTSTSTVKSEQAAFRSEAKSAGIAFTER